MKRTIIILALAATTISLAIHYATRPVQQNPPPIATVPPVTEPPVDSTTVTATAPKAKQTQPVRHDPSSQIEAGGAPAPASVEAIALTAAIDTLTSPRATYAEKQAAWKQLQDSGRLADAAAELEQRMAADPKNAVYPATLGQAYLKLCATSTDVRAQGIWAMTADVDFETALKLDPSNWDARFTKAVAMSYWPDNLNKGSEVIQQFNTLIQQQEQQSPQPQFAQAYEWLGKQYQKSGQADAALQVWQRGAALYPDNQPLQNLLATAATPRQ